MTGFFVAELNQRRRLLAEHLKERERQMRLRQEAEQQVRILIETSPLAILTLDQSGRVLLANESARQLLGFDDESLQGDGRGALPADSAPHAAEPRIPAPTCAPMWNARRSAATARFFWPTSGSPPTAPRRGRGWPRWSGTPRENLRDREGAGLDSMMATSRVLIGAISHEIRNLASAAASAHARLADGMPACRAASSTRRWEL